MPSCPTSRHTRRGIIVTSDDPNQPLSSCGGDCTSSIRLVLKTYLAKPWLQVLRTLTLCNLTLPYDVVRPTCNRTATSFSGLVSALTALSASQAPRLHAILTRRQTSPLPVLSPDVAAVAAALPALRLTALELLGTALGGDLLAAEYLLMQLVSRYACVPRLQPLLTTRTAWHCAGQRCHGHSMFLPLKLESHPRQQEKVHHDIMPGDEAAAAAVFRAILLTVL